MSLPKTSRALKITMEPHRRHAAATDSCSCSGIHAGRRRRASSGANFAQFGTSPARTRCAMSIAFGQCAHPLRRQAHCQGLARTGWTVRLQSVPNRASARNRDNFASGIAQAVLARACDSTRNSKEGGCARGRETRAPQSITNSKLPQPPKGGQGGRSDRAMLAFRPWHNTGTR